ncbi:MAG TPA: hypothetical protein VGM51_02395 [Armatimonadota bacterium]|jgi:hypothetical protein
MHWVSPNLAVTGVLLLAGCAKPPAKPVEDLGGGQNVAHFKLTSLKGIRNGDRLDVQAVYGDGSGRLAVSLHFQVTPPTHLESGAWNGLGGDGTVHERTSTFLGGQSGPPSIGGSFDLLAPDGRPLYRVSIPVQPLGNPLSDAGRWAPARAAGHFPGVSGIWIFPPAMFNGSKVSKGMS